MGDRTMNDTASRILESALRDNADDAGFQERHERRVTAMRALGTVERTNTRLYATLAIFAIVFILAITIATFAHAYTYVVHTGGGATYRECDLQHQCTCYVTRGRIKVQVPC
jgi:hypothetical protein